METIFSLFFQGISNLIRASHFPLASKIRKQKVLGVPCCWMVRPDERKEPGVLCQLFKIGIVSGKEPIPLLQGNGCFQGFEGILQVPGAAVRGRQCV